MTNEQETFRRNTILRYPIGSHLYGTNTPTSDTDYCGVFIAPQEYYLGLKHVEEVDLSVVSKQENGRNAADAVDFKLYEIRKFVKLALDNNPNVIEQLFMPHDLLLESTPIGKFLLNRAHLFPWAGCYDKFIGYAVSQKHKMVIKRDNMNGIVEALEHLKALPMKSFVAEHTAHLVDRGGKDTGQHLMFGDCSVQKNDRIEQAIDKLETRRSRFSGRYEDMVSKHGFDTKFASHLIRLLLEGAELLETGWIEFPLKNRSLVLDIKQGKFTIEQVMALAEDLENNMRSLKEMTKLPKKPRFDEVEKLLVGMVKSHWEGY